MMDARVKPGHDEWIVSFPGRATWREPGIHTPSGGYGFRARRFVAPRNDSDPYTLPFSASPISSSTLGSSMVAGMVQGSPSAIFLMVPRRILPERVFGR